MSSDVLGVFTFLWAQAMLPQVVKLVFSLAWDFGAIDRITISWAVLMGGSCLLGVLQPGAGEATLCLTTVGVLVLWFTGSQSNHVFMDLVVSLAVLLTYSADRARWRAQATHAIRSFLGALYFVTALHKMNTDWFGIEHSCCTLMSGGVLALAPLRGLLPFVPLATLPTLAVLTEMALPTLLLLDRFHNVTAILGCLFHLAICVQLPPMSVYPFSILMAPCYLFVIPGQSVALFDGLRPWAWVIAPLFAVACRMWLPVMAGGARDADDLFEYPPYNLWAPGVAWCTFVNVALAGAAIWYPANKGGLTPEAAESRPTQRGRALAFVVLLFGLTPYFGVRNYPALAMFSNLRTEGGRSNHLFIRDDFDLLGWQRDYVTVHATDIRPLLVAQVDLGPLFTPATKEALASAGLGGEFWITPPAAAWPYPETRPFKPYSMPYVELRRRVSSFRAVSDTGFVRYTRTVARAQLAMPWLWQLLGLDNPESDVVRANLTYDVAAGGDPELEEPLPRWLAMVTRFRSFDVEYSPCRH